MKRPELMNACLLIAAATFLTFGNKWADLVVLALLCNFVSIALLFRTESADESEDADRVDDPATDLWGGAGPDCRIGRLAAAFA